jgi:hypothetical protein
MRELRGVRGAAAKRGLFGALAALHRWLGVALCVPFLIWFVSGIVLTFQGFPALSEGELLERSAPLEAARVEIGLAEAARRSGFRPEQVSLQMLGTHPVWRLESAERLSLLSAENGASLLPLSESSALDAARSFFRRPIGAAAGELLRAPDQWTPRAERDGQLPLLRVAAGDELGSELYVSLSRGELVQRTTRRSRIAAYFGAIPHFWYPVALRRHGPLWRRVVLVGAGLGTLSAALGLGLGLAQLRLAQLRLSREPRRWSPYAGAWLRWHHLLGLGAGLFTLSWIGSGMLSLNPGRWSPGADPSSAEVDALRGPAVDPAGLELGAAEALRRCAQVQVTKALELVQLASHPYWLCRSRWNESRLLDARAPESSPVAALDLGVLRGAVRGALGAAALRVSWLSEPDAYVYPSYREPEQRFPIARFELADGRSWYVDPQSLELRASYSRRSKLERWFYQGLHRLDFAPLYRVHGLWQGLVITLCAAGAAFSVSGVVLAWRRLVRWLRRVLASSARG